MVVLYWLICVLIGLIPALLVWRRDRKSSSKYKLIPTILRGLSFFTIAMLLLAPAFKWDSNSTQVPKIIWLQDNSTSFLKSLGTQKDVYEERRKKVINQLDDYEVVPYAFGGGTQKGKEYNYLEKITNIDQAITTVIQKYKGAHLGAIILPTDGIFNEGANPLYIGQVHQTPIYAIGIGDSSEVKDIVVLRVFANKVVMMGNPFEVAVDVKFSKLEGTNHEILLSSNGGVLQRKTVSITEANLVISTSFEIKPSAPGLYKYSISVPTVDNERTTINNKLDFFVQVVDNQAKVLILNAGTHPDIGYIRNALKSTIGYDVTVAAPNSLPEHLSDFKTIIAHQPQLTQAQWERIRAAQIPTWHILGLQTTAAQATAINSWYSATVGGTQLLTPRYKSSFTTFKLPLSAATVVNKLPPLESNISTASAKEKNAVIITSSDAKDMWMVLNGQTPVAVTIGEGLWRWGVYEYKDNRSNAITHELIQQTVRILNVPKVDKPFQVYLSKKLLTDNESLNFSAELRNKSGQLVNDAAVSLVITDQEGKEYKHEFDKMGDAYTLTIPSLSQGIYQYTGSVTYQGTRYIDQGSFVIESIPLEDINLQADYALLYQLASVSNGHFSTLSDMLQIPDLIKKNEQIKPKIISETKQEPFISYPWLLALLIVLLTAEWLLRKYYAMQ